MLQQVIIAAAVAAGFVLMTGPFFIPELHKLKFGQSIREEGPKCHQKKSGTPTMGGIMMILAVIVACLMWIPFDPHIIVALWLFTGYGLIGFIDDGLKIFFKRNLGLTAKQKMALQILVAAVYLLYPGDVYSTKIWIPLVNASVDLGYFYPVFILLLLVGTTNAVNLTDGLDGLAVGVTIPVMLAFAAIASLAGLPHECLFSLAVFGSCVGFLRYNHYPAKVFMGDTGSLALGGAVAAAAIGTHTEILLVLIGGVYVVETVSVIMQVLYFKKTGGKRIFRMTPIHHHFELGGWPETTVVARFCLASIICSGLGVLLYVLR